MKRRRFIKTGLIFVPALVLPHDLVNCSSFLPIPTLNDDTYRWAYNAIPNAGSSVSAATIMKNDSMVTKLRQYGLRPKIRRLNSYSGNDLNALQALLIADTTWGGGSTDVLGAGLSAGQYTEATGLTTAGAANQYLNTGITLTQHNAQSTFHIAYYCRTGSNESKIMTGIQLAPLAIGLYVSYAGTSYFFDGGNSAFASAVDSAGTGFYCGSKLSSSDRKLFKNGSQLAANTTNDPTLGSGSLTFLIHCHNDSVLNANQYTTRCNAFESFGDGLTATEVATYNTIVQQYQTAMSRNV